ncbi:hypothetical protein EOM86_11870, partial [Candidatus Nomurabacteria bacterium]|nr:hypothetical protein [Candidatus Nomurabacteria bacterium]
MKFKDLLKLLAYYIVLFIAGSFIYVLSIRFGVFDRIPVFFYREIVAIVVSGIIISGVFWAVRRKKMKKIITVRDVILLFCLFC